MKSKIFKALLNSIGIKNKTTVKNQTEEEKKKIEEEKKNAEANKDGEMKNVEGAVIETENGEKIPLEDAIAAYKSQVANQDTVDEGGETGGDDKTLSPDDVIEVDGKPVKVSDLIAACGSSKKNAEQAQDTVAEDVVDQKDATMKNSKDKKINYFKVVKNAVKQVNEPKVLVNTSDERFKRGQERYGKKEVKE